METVAAVTHEAITPAELSRIVRRVTGRGKIEIREWQLERLGGGIGNPVSAGLYRLGGNGADGGDQVPWSVILKVIQSPANVGWSDMGEGDDAGHWNYWKRELLLYPSGLLDTLPEGLAAAHCFGAEERPGNTAWLWLEDIRDEYGGVWTLERYALTARHLGRLNGAYAGGLPLPAHPWLARRLLQQWITTFRQLALALPWEHPLVLAHYPRPERNAFRRMLVELERFQDALALLPETLCHGDTYPTNFMSRRTTGGGQETVALDWALAGAGTLGEDLGQFTFGAWNNLPAARLSEVIEALFNSYRDGLEDAGCRVDPKLLRLGFAACAALRVGFFQTYLMGETIRQGTGATAETTPPPAPQDCYEVVMADEAFRLLESI